MNHTFAVCAYKESPYLEECINSLEQQSLKSDVLMITSTPNEHIDSIAKKHDIPLYINEGEGGITQDWNFALSKVTTKYATVTHQDDIYEPDYSSKMVERLDSVSNPLIAFSDSGEIRNGTKTTNVQMLKIKEKMMIPLRAKVFSKSRFIRRRVLSFGDPICCPSVTFNLEAIPQPIFRNHFQSCEDWEAWEKISKMQGDFVYIRDYLMYHRIHEESATTQILANHARVAENYEMFCKFWPKPIARFINRFYTRSEKSNKLENV